MLGSLGVTEILLLLLIVVILFGATRIPQLGKGLGEGLRNFKRSLRDSDSSDSDTTGDDAKK